MRYGSVILTLLFAPLLLADAQWITLDPEMQDSVADVTVLADNEDSTVIEFSLPGFYWDTMTVCSTLTKQAFFKIDEFDTGYLYSDMGVANFPVIPTVSVFVIIPPRPMVAESYETIGDTVIDDFLVTPLQLSACDPCDPGFSDSIYSTSDSFPREPVSFGFIQQGGQLRSIAFTVRPMRYNASDTSLKVYKKIRVKLDYFGEDTTSIYPDSVYKMIKSNRRLNSMIYINWGKWSL